MTKRPSPEAVFDEKAISRRTCVRGAVALTIGAPILGASALASRPAEAIQKTSKRLASYQDHPKGKSAMCAVCKYFMPPASCMVVKGTISPEGWCQRFDRRSDKT